MAKIWSGRGKKLVAPSKQVEQHKEVLVEEYFTDERGRYFRSGEEPVIINTRREYTGISIATVIQSGLKKITKEEFEDKAKDVLKHLKIWTIINKL